MPAVIEQIADRPVVLRIEHGAGRMTVELRASIPGALDDATPSTVAAVVDAVRTASSGGEPIWLVADHPPTSAHPLPDAVAEALGLEAHRDLFQLRRPLPVPADHPERGRARVLAVRAFDPRRDGPAWIRQNNRAFADHPDQGSQNEDTLAATLAEAWVDLAGFLVVDDPQRHGELAGSCWTRVHPAEGDDPALGEIFVVGVDPSHRGEGLGSPLVLAGLDHLAAAGIGTAMLYVDATNEPARHLYARLGFTPHLRRRVSSRPTPIAGGPS